MSGILAPTISLTFYKTVVEYLHDEEQDQVCHD